MEPAATAPPVARAHIRRFYLLRLIAKRFYTAGFNFTQELIDNLGVNLHRIDKDVLRCDRNMAYFTTANLEKLRNVASLENAAKRVLNSK